MPTATPTSLPTPTPRCNHHDSIRLNVLLVAPRPRRCPLKCPLPSPRLHQRHFPRPLPHRCPRASPRACLLSALLRPCARPVPTTFPTYLPTSRPTTVPTSRPVPLVVSACLTHRLFAGLCRPRFRRSPQLQSRRPHRRQSASGTLAIATSVIAQHTCDCCPASLDDIVSSSKKHRERLVSRLVCGLYSR